MRDQGGSGAASTSAADHPRRSRRGLRSGHSPDPSIVRPADAPQPLLPGAHPPFLDPPLPLTGPDAPVLNRVDPPLLLTGPDAPIIDFVDPPLGPPEPDNPKYVQFSREPIVCLICNKVSNHMLPRCPFMLLATCVFEEDPPEYIEYLSYFARYEDVAGISGFGFAEYNKEELELITAEAERITAEAARLRQEDGLNLVKISELPKEKSDAEKLYNAIKIYGPVTHVLTFPEHRFGFVGFVRVKDAESAIRESNLSGCYGHLTFG